MPRFDATGPFGLDPGTGRGLGPCGAGMGWGRKFGGGWMKGYWPFWKKLSKNEELSILEEAAKNAESDLKEIQKRINELKG